MSRLTTIALAACLAMLAPTASAQTADDAPAQGVPRPPSGGGPSEDDELDDFTAEPEAPRAARELGAPAGTQGPLGIPAPSGYEATAVAWPAIPGGPTGVEDPVLRVEPDEELMIAGGVFFGVSYAMGFVLTLPFSLIGGCWPGPCSEGYAAMSLVPVFQWATAWTNTGGRAAAGISGAVFAPLELVGLIMILAGALHQHPRLVPRETMPEGAVSFTGDGFRVHL
jgi:hypothetical protein